MKYQVLRGFSLGGGVDVQPGDIAEIPPHLRHMLPAWRAQGKIGDQVVEEGSFRMVHKGGGKYDVLDDEGNVLKSKLTKADAEKELAWLLKED